MLLFFPLREGDLSHTSILYYCSIIPLGIKIPVVDPMKCVAKVANKLCISEKTKHQAMNIMEEVVNKKIALI